MAIRLMLNGVEILRKQNTRVIEEGFLMYQTDFDLTIGQLDHALSKLVIYGKDPELDLPNKQTLKHHAEDMIAAGQNILKNLGERVEGLPQPSGG